ncbi:Topoisomerase 1-associated factor 1 [Fusarium irregulare]|uniref:Topoisomerase 1-associated factor 1 n=1 Tax=Fusarium irregulare TaxID=2494466 RepID=A0A9W8PZ36_9HYPO|nr:Topoisomerase 1-associated factor 1 [Fusarium irregulare]KAJ4021106.1 Topoisomerase 1-associated factor 1 [Fusarium irregulare]
MELADGSTDIVHPEVRAHITSLVSALGGVSADDDGRYQLGDDALEVLRDLKRWIRFYDEKTNRMDVARCIYEANLIEGDLLPILATWPENATDSKFKARIALACFELMVPLTWPMEKDRERMTVNHHRHMPVLQLAQVRYKRDIINYDGARILHTAVRVALPSMAIPIGDRTQRDQGIIKLVLFFLRNVAMIEPPPDVKYEGDESQISRSATIDAFSYQDIFLVLLTLASNMGEDFRTEDTTVMEIIYHLVKQVDSEKLFMNENQLSKAKAGELASMMNKEQSMLNAYNRKGPTRHNRFGTMIWVKRDDGKMSSLSGQDALADASLRNQKLDSSKTYRPPRRPRKATKDDKDLGLPAKLNSRAYDQLRSFVEEFLDAGFNPLFQHVRKTIDREAPHVMPFHRRQFFYLVSWFLEAERMRRKAKKQSGNNTSEEVSSFNLIAGVLNQEMFITLTKALHESIGMKDWYELTAVMRCFTQILLTVQEMSQSGNEDDEEIAENVLSRLFYEEETHDAIAKIIRDYKDQGFDYLDAATELVHHFLRILESYSKQNIDMQIRSKQRTRRKKKAAQNAAGAENDNDENDGSDDDAASAEKTNKERKFDFSRFANRFAPQAVVDTFVTFTKYYQDMTDEQLKRAHRYFYRIAFKSEASVMLFRVDIIHLFYNMIKGQSALDKSSSMFKEWEELVKQILRKCFKKLEQRPELLVEMLFSKTGSTAFFLEYGFERQTVTAAKAKPAPELAFKNTEELDRQIAIVVGAMLDKNQADHIAWIKKILAEAETERRAFTAAEEARTSIEPPQEDSEEQPAESGPKLPPTFFVRPDEKDRQTAMFKNSYMRLLMNLVGIKLLGTSSDETPESLWIIPAEVSADVLKDGIHYINQAEFNPPTFEEGVLAEHQLKRKTAPRQRAAFDDDDDNDVLDHGDYTMSGPTARKVIDDNEGPKTPRKKRKPGKELTEEEKEEKRRRRRKAHLEKKNMEAKSTTLVTKSDDESDSEANEAFFARERKQAKRAPVRLLAGSLAADKEPAKKATKKTTKKRAATVTDSSSSSDEEDTAADTDDDDDSTSFIRRAMNGTLREEEDEEMGDTLPDGSDGESRKRRRLSEEKAQPGEDKEMGGTDNKGQDDEDEEVPVVTRRPRVRGGFVVDSDDDE